ncbi:hypothetical protein Btru_045908 [Bulinus truncatus]|nr:hypothetical protein Btru_045908 [Bulinus truncatus]
MFSWRRDSADISCEEPTFHVRYVGHTIAYLSSGVGCTSQPLKTLWGTGAVVEKKSLHRVVVKLGLEGLEVTDLEKSNGDKKPKIFDMENISYCAADKSVDDRLFCWIYKNPLTDELEAHAVLCSTREKSQTMAAVMARAFHLAYKDWKADRQREERRKALSLRKISLDDDFHENISEYSGNHKPISCNHKNWTGIDGFVSLCCLWIRSVLSFSIKIVHHCIMCLLILAFVSQVMSVLFQFLNRFPDHTEYSHVMTAMKLKFYLCEKAVESLLFFFSFIFFFN